MGGLIAALVVALVAMIGAVCGFVLVKGLSD